MPVQSLDLTYCRDSHLVSPRHDGRYTLVINKVLIPTVILPCPEKINIRYIQRWRLVNENPQENQPEHPNEPVDEMEQEFNQADAGFNQPPQNNPPPITLDAIRDQNTNLTEDVDDIEENKHTKVITEIGTNVIDLDEYSDDELLSSLNPSVANRLMTRRKGKAISQSFPEKNAKAKSTVKDSIKKKSTSAGPIKSRVVAKSVGVGPSKSWSKVVPKKRKEREIVESESDVEGDVPNIPSRKKPTTSKLAASIPEIPIDNVSFHYASSASRLKYVLQKRLAVERELTPNALENKEILELIQEAGLLKTV
ncbi:uncharacterized protein LOC131629672 [Vicia villosa]|uniref:uncharacterized protein LOC131629672 n=1 Tax=Vicia villosa TaxID=3911 RepID=UPI00273AE058|nr:uncharacterized protein LOC131629672 [Vicia villosa]